MNRGILTPADLTEAYKRIEHLKGKIVAGIVCSLDYYSAVRDLARTTADYSLFGAIEVYVDAKQKEPYKEFYNREELQKYLERNDNLS